MSFTLYELKDRYLELLNYIETEDQEASAFEDTLAMIEGDLEDKVDNIVKLIKSLEAETKAIEEEKKRLEARISSRKNRVGRLKQYLEENLIDEKTEKVKTPLFSVWIQNNPPSVEIENENSIPAEYKIQQPDKIDKKAILEILKKGDPIEGATIKTSRSIRLR